VEGGRRSKRDPFAVFRHTRFESVWLGVILVAPLVVVLVGLLLYPVVSAILVSFQSKFLGSPGKFIGLGNYIEMFTQDQAILEVLSNSVTYTVGSVVLKVIIGFVTAMLLNEHLVARSLFRGWMLLPWIIPTLVVGLTWRWMFDQSGGILNFVLVKLGLIDIPPAWLADKVLARIAIVLANVWRGFPFFTITILAGLQSIPLELYEAAEMDGATLWRKIRHITIPSIKPVVLITVILSTIWTFNDFELLWVMTGGGPSYSTHIFTTYAYQLGFKGSRFGYATAVSLVALPLIILFILYLVPKLWGDDE
jgi:multiple sugar transport system permease protein